MSYDPTPGSVPFRVLAHMELLHKGSEITTGMLGTALGIDSNGLATQLGRAVEARLLFVRQKGGHEKSPKFWSLVDHSKDGHVAPPPGPQTALQRVTKVQPIAATSHSNGVDIDDVHRTRDRVVDMEYTAGQDSQQVLKADGETRDATDRESVAIASPSVGSMGAGQVADATAAAADPPSPAIARAMKVRQLRAPSRPAPVPEGVRQLTPDNADDIRIALWSDGTLEIRAFDAPTMVLRRQQARQLVDYLNAIDLDALDEEPVA